MPCTGHAQCHWGHHGLACKKSRGRQGRHSELNNSIRRALRSAKVTSGLELLGLNRGDNKRPDGLTVYPWKYGKPLVWDVTVEDTLASSYIATTQAAESRKQRKYEHLEDRFIVQPIGFETSGTWGPAARSFLSDIGRQVQRATGRKKSSEFL